MTDRELMQQALDALEKHVLEYETAELLRARLARIRCIVKDCQNHRHEGKFVGDLCSPCHTFITTGECTYSQAYRNSQREWQGLTAKDLAEIPPSCYEGAIWADAKLKEKNT